MILTAVVNPSLAPSIKASYTFTFFLTPVRMKAMIISISMMFAVEVLTLFISIESIRPKPQMTEATTRAAPPRVSRMVRFSRLIFWKRLVMMMPARVEKNVASRMGMKISVGWAAPIWAR